MVAVLAMASSDDCADAAHTIRIPTSVPSQQPGSSAIAQAGAALEPR
jgi:hypothetical protein